MSLKKLKIIITSKMYSSNTISISLIAFMIAVFLFYGNCMAGPQFHYILILILDRYPSIRENCITFEDALQYGVLIASQYGYELTQAFLTQSWGVVGNFIINSGWFN